MMNRMKATVLVELLLELKQDLETVPCSDSEIAAKGKAEVLDAISITIATAGTAMDPEFVQGFLMAKQQEN